MKRKVIVPLVLLLTGCGLMPTPNDFPSPPPMTVIVEIPQVTATTTLEPRMRPILPDDLQEAETTFLIVKTAMAAGDVRIAELVKYPIRVKLNRQEMLIRDEQEFLDQYDKIFDEGFITTLFEMDEENLVLAPNGVQVGNGELWFNYYCTDLSCSDSQFLITQINR